MPDHLNNESSSADPSPETHEPDVYEREIDELWQTVKGDFTNHSLHQTLLFLTSRYLLFDRVARYYAEYLLEHPDDETARKFRDELVLLTTSTLMKRQGRSVPESRRRTLSWILPGTFFLLVVIGGLLFVQHVSTLQKNMIAVAYNDELRALVKGDLETERDRFIKVM